jgi:hypothetical protein
LSLKVLQLLLFGRQEETVIVESDFSECDGIVGCFGGGGKFVERREKGGGTPSMGFEVFC